MFGDGVRRRLFHRAPVLRAVRPRLEGLEDRFLLYATTGTQWAKPKLITYSFVPDGTSIGGVPSNLQSTLNAKFATSDWMAQFAKAAVVWQKVANVNFTLVSDNGSPLGVAGNQQKDSRFGDIRIGGYAMSGGILAFAYLAPPANGGTDAGDMFFNTTQSWQINGTTYDLETVAIHEFGHAIGMGHSSDNAAAMYPSYVTTRQAVDADDTNGVRSIYNSRQNDYFDANGSNDTSRAADDITSYIDTNAQLTISALDSTTPVMIGTNDIDWYKITVPSTTTGTMVVKMQATGLSLLAPTLAIYGSNGTTKLGQLTSYTMGDTVSLTVTGVSPGQVYDIKCWGSTSGDSGFGAYGLQVNFGSLPQNPVTAPDTTMAEQADQGGGTMSETTDGTVDASIPQDATAVPGVPTFWVYNDGDNVVSEDNGVVGAVDPSDNDDSAADVTPPPDDTTPTDGQVINVGEMTGVGDAMMINQAAERQLDSQPPGALAPWAPLWRPTAPISIFRPNLGTEPSGQNVMTTMEFFSSDCSVNPQLMTLTLSRNRRTEPVNHQAVDLAIQN